ncbi:MAG: GxxExxY protein [Bacteroidales bacterium]|nr:GxxExxY protein [Bacteroidales bacterium]
MDKIKRGNLVTQIYDAAREVHEFTGPGVLASVYKSCLMHELRLRTLRFRSNPSFGIMYKGLKVDDQVSIDLSIEEEVLIEIVTLPGNIPNHLVRMQTALTFSGYPLGIILDIHQPRLIDGFKKINNPKRT